MFRLKHISATSLKTKNQSQLDWEVRRTPPNFILKSVAPPSHNVLSCRIRPVSEGRDRRHPSPRRRRPRPAGPRPPPGGRPQPRSAAAQCLGPEGARWRRDAPSHMSCFGGFRKISGLKNWEFGHVWSTISN